MSSHADQKLASNLRRFNKSEEIAATLASLKGMWSFEEGSYYCEDPPTECYADAVAEKPIPPMPLKEMIQLFNDTLKALECYNAQSEEEFLLSYTEDVALDYVEKSDPVRQPRPRIRRKRPARGVKLPTQLEEEEFAREVLNFIGARVQHTCEDPRPALEEHWCKACFEEHRDKMGTAQMFDNITQLPESANNAFKSVTALADTLKGYAEQLKKYFTLPDLDTVSLITNCLSFGYSVYKKDYISMGLSGVSIARQLGLELSFFGDCWQLAAQWVEAQIDLPGFRAQSSFDISWVGAVFMVISTSLAKGYIPSYDTMSKLLSDFGRSAIGFKNLKELMGWMWDYCRRLYYHYACGIDIEAVDKAELYPGLEDALRVCDMVASSEFKNVYLDRSRELCKIVIDTVNELDALKKQALTVRDQALTSVLASKITALEKVAKVARNSAAFCRATKVAPTAVFLYGEAGVGKSVLVEYMKCWIHKEYYSDTAWTPTDISFTKAVDSDYWDGYTGQPILCYDDIFQKKDSQSSPCSDFMDVINIVNESPYHLNMSSVEDKKNVYMECGVLLASSNSKTINPQSIVSADAVRRRFDLSFQVRPKQMFLHNDGKKLDLDKVSAYQQGNGTKGFCADAYELVEINTETGLELDPTKAPLTLPEFLNLFKLRHTAKKTKSEDLGESIRLLLGNEEVTDVSDGLSTFVDKVKTKAVAQSSENITFFTAPKVCAKYFQELLYGAQTEEALSSYEEYSDCEEDTASFLSDVKYGDEYDWYKKVTEKAVRSRDVAFAAYDKCCERASKFYNETMPSPESYKATYKLCTNTASNWFMRVLNLIYKPKEFALGICNGVLVAAASVLLYKALARTSVGCKLYNLYSFEEMKHYAGSCKCDECKGLYRPEKVKSVLGSAEHALGLCRYLAENARDEELKNRFAVIYAANAKTVYAEMYEHKAQRVARGYIAEATPYYAGQNVAKPRGYLAEQYYSGENKHVLRGYMAEDGSPTIAFRNGVYDQSCVASTLNIPRYLNDMPVAQSSDASMLQQHEVIVRTNMVRLVGDRGRVNGLFLTGRCMLIPYHWWKTCGSVFQIRNPFMGLTTPIEKKACVAHRCTDLSGTAVDLVIVECPRTIPSRRSILNYFAPATTVDMIREGCIVVCGMREMGEVPVLHSHTAKTFCLEKAMLQYRDHEETFKIARALSYDVDTKAGDCGSIVMVKNKSMLGKIVGMHLAGMDGNGFSAILSREFLERNMRDVSQTETLVDARIPFLAPVAKMATAEMMKVPHTFKTPALDGDYVSLGNLPEPSNSGKSQIVPSLIAGAVGAVTMMPAFLRPIKVGGELVDPMKQGIKKVMTSQPILPTAILQTAVDSVAKIHCGNDGDKCVLTYEQALTGITGTNVAPLNRTSSPGYPYTLKNPGKGKQHWFGNDEWIINEEIRKDVDDLINAAKEKKRSDVIYVATLKDERRPVEKVMAGKTRVFAAAPMHFVIAFRMYFASFIASVMDNHIDNEVGVGTNVYNMDWHKTGMALERYGKHVIAGDFSNFDGSLHQEILWSICDIVNKWYGDSEENQTIRKVLFEDICNARMLVNGEIVHMTHSQPSGNPMTVIVNSLFNQIVMRMAYLDLKIEQGAPMVCDFEKHVSMQTYGDDNCLNIHPDTLEWYNQISITRSLAKFGLTYTDEGKTGELVASRRLQDIGYLKRKFVLNEYGHYKAPLNFDVIIEMCNWVKGTTTPIASLEQNVETAMTELGLYGKDVYNDYSARFARACAEVRATPNIPTWNEIEDVHYHFMYGQSMHGSQKNSSALALELPGFT